MSTHPFEPGAEYRLTRDAGDMHAGDHVIFWRHTYSHYDGINFYFFASPDAYYKGRPGPNGRPDSAHLFSLELCNDQRRDAIGTEFERVAGPRPGPAWMVQWWEQVLAEALKRRPA